MENNEFLWHELLIVRVCPFSSGCFVSFLFFKIASEIYSSFVLHVSFCVHLLSLLWEEILCVQYILDFWNGVQIPHCWLGMNINILMVQHTAAACDTRQHPHLLFCTDGILMHVMSGYTIMFQREQQHRSSVWVYTWSVQATYLVLVACIEPTGHCAHVVWVLNIRTCQI